LPTVRTKIVEKEEIGISDSHNLMLNCENEPQETNVEAVDELPPSPADVKQNIKLKFLVEMPDDFYQFWAFCQSICPKNTLGKLHHLIKRFIILF
jgi:hypothetical protein